MLAVYETIDLGLVSLLKGASSGPNEPLLDLLQANYPVFVSDPVHPDTIYLYHAFGVHALDLAPALEPLAEALRSAGEDNIGERLIHTALEGKHTLGVQSIVSTFSSYQKLVIL
jgi:nucleoporin NUP82